MMSACGNQVDPSPPNRSQLQIEVGMHTACICRISSDARGHFAVTAGEDMTARVWDVATGQLQGVLRPPSAPGYKGYLYVTSMSPNGETVAAAGLTGYESDRRHNIYLFKRSTGQLLQRLTGLPDEVCCLTHSPDGEWLVATLGAGGIRVWQLASDGTAVQPSDPLVDSAYGGASYGASFQSRSLLATVCDDYQVRLYRLPGHAGQNSAHSLTLRPSNQVAAPGIQEPSCIAFSPCGLKLAVASERDLKVVVLDAHTLCLLHSTKNEWNYELGVNSLAWSADGQHLLAVGYWGAGGATVRTWPQAGRGEPVDVVSFHNVTDLHALPNGHVLVATSDPMWGFLDLNNSPIIGQILGSPSIASPCGIGNFAVSANGQQVRINYHESVNARCLFDVKQRKILPDVASSVHQPRTTGLAVKNWDNEVATFFGHPLKFERYEKAHFLAQTADAGVGRGGFVVGTRCGGGYSCPMGCWRLRFFNAFGQQVWEQPAPSEILGVNIPPEGKMVVAAFSDGSIRWHRLTDGRELLALCPHVDGKRWVLWTPLGYYDASPGGDSMLGWQVDRGEDAAADFFPASQFRHRFYRPDVIDRVLDTLDEVEAIKQADAERGNWFTTRLDTHPRMPSGPAEKKSVTTDRM